MELKTYMQMSERMPRSLAVVPIDDPETRISVGRGEHDMSIRIGQRLGGRHYEIVITYEEWRLLAAAVAGSERKGGKPG